MALRPLLTSAVIGIAALGFFHSPTADAQGYVSISVGTPQSHYNPYYGTPRYGSPYTQRIAVDRYGTPRIPGGFQRGGYDNRGYRHDYRPGYTLVPGHWVRTHRGRVWMPAQYVRVQSNRGYGYNDSRYYGSGYNQQVIYRSGYDPRYRTRGW